MDILGPDRGKMTIYGSDFQQVNLTPNRGVSPTDKGPLLCCILAEIRTQPSLIHVLNTGKNEEDPIKNEGARVFTRFLTL